MSSPLKDGTSSMAECHVLSVISLSVSVPEEASP